MKISELLDENKIILSLNSTDKWAAIEKLLNTASQDGQFTPTQLKECLDALNRREQISSTYVGNNIAFPHATVSCIDEPVLALAVSEKGVLFDESNNQYAKIIALFVVPQSQIKSYAGFLSKIASILNKKEVRNKLIHCSSTFQVVEIIKQEE